MELNTHRLANGVAEVSITARLYTVDGLVDTQTLRPVTLQPGQTVEKSFRVEDGFVAGDYALGTLALSSKLGG